jgi:hypothetical protein
MTLDQWFSKIIELVLPEIKKNQRIWWRNLLTLNCWFSHENFKKPETKGWFDLENIKEPELKALWLWQFSKKVDLEVINKIWELHNTDFHSSLVEAEFAAMYYGMVKPCPLCWLRCEVNPLG